MRIVLGVVVALVLAGCASDGGGQKTDDFEDKPVEVDETTGAIRGVVVDQSITPVADVKVVLKSEPPQETVTDAEGRFTFGKLDPGFYILNASKPLFRAVEVQTSVEAGNALPPVVRVQITRIFSGEPSVTPFDAEGYFTCSQANFPGYLYSSSSCHDNNIGGFVGSPAPSTDLSDYGVELPQQRTFHQDVANGWQTLIFEMTWTPSAQGTSDRMGMVVSTEKETRNAAHSFANVASGSPMRIQLDVGEAGPGSNGVDDAPQMIPPEGWTDMSFFMSVRPPQGTVCAVWCVPPGLALEQSFYVYLHQFNLLPAPEGWSVVNGDTVPY